MTVFHKIMDFFVSFWDNYGVSIICSLFFLFVGYFVLKILKMLVIKSMVRIKVNDRFILNLVRKLLQVGVWTFVVALILKSFNVPISKITVTLAPVFLVIGLGFKNFISNFIKSVQLKLLNPYDVGDVVEVDGIKGRVERVDFLYTYLYTQEGGFTTISNSQIVDKRISNFTKIKSLAANFDFEDYKNEMLSKFAGSTNEFSNKLKSKSTTHRRKKNEHVLNSNRVNKNKSQFKRSNKAEK